MLYIHQLSDLNPKSAEIESVQMIRDIKNNPERFSEERLRKELSVYFISIEEIDKMILGLEHIEPAINKITKLTMNTNNSFEVVNLQRAISQLKEIPENLKSNIKYAESIIESQELISFMLYKILTNLPTIKSQPERMVYEQQIKSLFEKVLRNKENFVFRGNDIVHEGPLAQINALKESMGQGFFYTVKLDEHLNKLHFNDIKDRINKEDLLATEDIKKDIDIIKDGVLSAYNTNMRMINMGLIMYSYIRSMRGF